MNRRHATACLAVPLLAAGIGTGLAGCAAPRPVPRQYQLRLDAPAGTTVPPSAPAASPGPAEVWQLVLPVRLPEYLDREVILVQSGDSGLETLPGARWAEPLRDAVPRVLQHDLAAWLGARAQVWAGAPPTGTPVARQLRLEIQAFEALASRVAVRLQARWSRVDPRAPSQPAGVFEADLTVPSEGPDAAALVQAHRLALWRLAERLAQAA